MLSVRSGERKLSTILWFELSLLVSLRPFTVTTLTLPDPTPDPLGEIGNLEFAKKIRHTSKWLFPLSL